MAVQGGRGELGNRGAVMLPRVSLAMLSAFTSFNPWSLGAQTTRSWLLVLLQCLQRETDAGFEQSCFFSPVCLLSNASLGLGQGSFSSWRFINEHS